MLLFVRLAVHPSPSLAMAPSHPLYSSSIAGLFSRILAVGRVPTFIIRVHVLFTSADNIFMYLYAIYQFPSTICHRSIFTISCTLSDYLLTNTHRLLAVDG